MPDFGGTELDAFRAEARAWLEANFPDSLRRGSQAPGELDGEPTGDAALWTHPPFAAETADEGSDARPTWGLLLVLAAIGGGPTFVGTAVGHAFTSEPLSVVFLTLAAGSIIYVVVQLLAIAGRSTRKDLVYLGVLVGLLAGFLTDAIVTAAGV